MAGIVRNFRADAHDGVVAWSSYDAAAPSQGDPTATPTCELLLTDPIAFRPASRADVRRTRP